MGVTKWSGGTVIDETWDGDAAEGRVRKWASSDGSGDSDKVDFDKYAKAWVYEDEDGNFKGLHHDVRDGKVVVAKQGVYNTARAIQGAREGINIPDEDMPAAKRHIARHYHQWDEKAPWESEEDVRHLVALDGGRAPIRMAAGNGRAELWLYGPVVRSQWATESDVCMMNVKRLVEEAGQVSEIVVNLASEGGDAFEGFDIYQFLSQHPARVIVNIGSRAASAASIVACAGDVIRIAETGLYLAHDPATIAWGTARDLRAVADDLDKLSGAARAAYMGCTKKRGKKVVDKAFAALMADDKYLSAAEALEWGFVDEVVPAKGNESATDQAQARSMRAATMHLVAHQAFAAAMAARPSVPRPGEVASSPVTEDQAMTINLATFVALLGLDATATEDAVLEAVRQRETERKDSAKLLGELEQLTGQKGSAMLAVVQAFKVSHEALPEAAAKLQAELDRQTAEKTAADEKRRGDLINEAINKTGKMTEAERAFWSAKPLADVEAYLAVAHPKIPGAGSSGTGSGSPTEAGALAASLTAEDRKVAAQLGISPEKFAAAKAEELKNPTASDKDDE